MPYTHRFVKSRNGITGFAQVEVDSSPSQEWSIEPGRVDQFTLKTFRAPVMEGIEWAMRQHEASSSQRFAIRIEEILYSDVDTKPDAMRCAAGLAAWKAMGHDAAEIEIVWEDEWRLTPPSGAR